MEETRIGDFSKPLTDVKPTAATSESPTKERLENAERRLDEQAQGAEATLRPMQTYEERLKEAGITKEEAATIVDSVLMTGSWSESIKVTQRIAVRLRTRTARDTRRIQDLLEVQRPVYDAHYTEIVGRMTLAASLEQLGPNKFSFPGKNASPEEYENAFKQRIEFIDTLADPVLRLLFQKLWKFDEKVRLVLSEGTVENF